MGNKPPLTGLRILVTRSRHQAGHLSLKLKELGAEPIEIPVIEIGPPSTWEPMDTALDQISEYHWIVFASVNAVASLLDRFESFGHTVDELVRIKLAAIGPATADALAERGLTATFKPTQFVAEALVAQFPGYPNLAGKKILWPRTNVGRSYIMDRLSEAGAQVDVVPAYSTSEPANARANAEQIVKLLKRGQLDVITLASSQSAANLGKMLALHGGDNSNESLARLLANIKVATIGPETAHTAVKALGKCDIEATQHTITGLVDSIANYYQANKH